MQQKMLVTSVTVFFLLTTHQLVRGISFDTFQAPPDEEFERAVLSNQNVFLVSETYHLYRLSPSLEEIRREVVSQSIRLFLAAANNTDSDERLLICGVDCIVIDSDYRIHWPSENAIFDVPRVLDMSMIGIDVDYTGTFQRSGPGRYELTYAQSGGEIDNSAVASRIVRGTLFRAAREDPEGKPDRFEIYANQFEIDPSQERQFIYTFTRNGFTYFISVLLFRDGSIQARVSRVCDSDLGPGDGVEGNFTSYIELVLQCEDNTGAPTAATFIATPNAFEADTLVLSVGITRLSEVRNRLCAYDVSAIDRMMEEKINECANGVGMAGLKRNSDNRTQCTTHQVGKLIIR